MKFDSVDQTEPGYPTTGSGKSIRNVIREAEASPVSGMWLIF